MSMKITGYRQLSDDEIALMNEGKGNQVVARCSGMDSSRPIAAADARP